MIENEYSTPSGKIETFLLLTLLFPYLLLQLWIHQDVCGFCQGNELQDKSHLHESPKIQIYIQTHI